MLSTGLLAGQSNAPQQGTGAARPAAAQANPPQTNAEQSSPTLAPQPPATKPEVPAAKSQADSNDAQNPKTEILDSSSTSDALAGDGHDPILDPPPFPSGTTTLVGGVISSLDRIRNRISIAVYGGGHWAILFDERTHIFRNGAEVTQLALKQGDRVYVDTMLDNNNRDIFARNIRVGVVTPPADIDGQIVDVNPKRGEITVRDSVGAGSVHFSVDQDTRISHGPAAASFRELQPGALVKVKFAADRADRGRAREIAIVALPGTSFTFAGAITFLDTHRGILALRNVQDGKMYDLHFSVASTPSAGSLAVGAEVTVVATFESIQYTAKQITVTKTAGNTAK